jgi:hypothetical protein
MVFESGLDERKEVGNEALTKPKWFKYGTRTLPAKFTT